MSARAFVHLQNSDMEWWARIIYYKTDEEALKLPFYWGIWD